MLHARHFQRAAKAALRCAPQVFLFPVAPVSVTYTELISEEPKQLGAFRMQTRGQRQQVVNVIVIACFLHRLHGT